MKIKQACVCSGSMEVEDDSRASVVSVAKWWAAEHACRAKKPDEDKRTGAGFAATQPALGPKHQAPGHIELDVRAVTS